MSNPVTPTVGGKTVGDVYTQVCNVMLEPGGLQLQLTPQDFLDAMQVVYLDWLDKTELVQTIYSQMGSFAVSQYTYPDEITRPLAVLYDGILLEHMDQQALDNQRGKWRGSMGEPQAWHEDGLADKTIEILPAPQFQGTNMAPAFGDFFAGSGAVSVVGPTRPTGVVLALNSPLPLIPDLFVPYLAYGVLHKFFSQDGETKDEARASYCRARFLEGIALASAITGSDLEETIDEA